MSAPVTITAYQLADALENKAGKIRAFAFQQPEAMLGQCQSEKCRAPIWWGTMAGRPHPFDLDGTPHFATCPDAERWRQRAQQKEIAARAQTNLFDAIEDAKRDRPAIRSNLDVGPLFDRLDQIGGKHHEIEGVDDGFFSVYDDGDDYEDGEA